METFLLENITSFVDNFYGQFVTVLPTIRC